MKVYINLIIYNVYKMKLNECAVKEYKKYISSVTRLYL